FGKTALAQLGLGQAEDATGGGLRLLRRHPELAYDLADEVRARGLVDRGLGGSLSRGRLGGSLGRGRVGGRALGGWRLRRLSMGERGGHGDNHHEAKDT